MIALLLALCWAGAVQKVHELEWDRAPASAIAAEAEGGEAELRLAAARALGRLHRADALEPLVALRDDPEAQVRLAVADALGGTPGAADALRAWLDALPAPDGLSARAAAAEGPRTRAIEALGRQGDASDIPRLASLCAEPWPTSAAASEALGRLGRRGIEGAEAGLPALIDALGRPDPRTVEAAAYGIRRIGLKSATPEQIQAVADRVLEPARPMARAWLVQSVAPHLTGDAVGDLFVAAATDPSPVVQVAALDSVGPEGVPVEVVAPWRLSRDGWVRQAAISALGRMGATEALREAADAAADPWEEAWAIRSAGDPLGRDPGDEALDLAVRAAALEVSDREPAALIPAARATDGPPELRTAAVSALLAREGPAPEVAEALVGAPDPVVREGALELLLREAPEAQIRVLVPVLRVERDLELLGTGLAQLADQLELAPKAVRADDPHLNSALNRAAAAPTARVRAAANAVADRLGIALPEARDAERVRELVLPDGSVVEVRAGAPVLAEVAAIRGARVRTDRGEFVLALDPETAPLAVANFALLAEAGFYDGRVFHRIVPGFVAQTGCPRGDGWGGPGWTLPDEVSGVPYVEGSVGMARSAPWDTGGSQWFVSTAPTPHLEGDYTRFGQVVQGMAVVRALRMGDRVLSIEIERLDGP